MNTQYWILIFSALGALGGVFGMLSYIKSCRKPHAKLYFDNGEKEITLLPQDDCDKYKISFRITNTGKLRLENYRVEVECLSGVQNIMSSDFLSLSHQAAVHKMHQQQEEVFFKRNECLRATFRPMFATILQAKDSMEFSFLCVPEPEAERVTLQWRIIGNDCYESGNLIVHINTANS